MLKLINSTRGRGVIMGVIMKKMSANQSGFSAPEALFIVLVIGFIGFIGWFAFTRYLTKDTQRASSIQTSSETSGLQPSEVTAKIKSRFEADYKMLDLDQNNQPAEGEMSVRISNKAPAHKAEGYDFYLYHDDGSSIDLMIGPMDWGDTEVPRQVDITVRQEIASIFKEFGLEKTETRGNAQMGTDTDIYAGRGMICVIESPESPTSSNSALCAQTESYEKAAKALQPLASALPALDQSTALSDLKITDSQTDGYQHARVSQNSIDGGGGSVALFYKSPSNTWIYFTNTQSVLPCAAYNTPDLRSAFKGDTCLDAADQQSTVQ